MGNYKQYMEQQVDKGVHNVRVGVTKGSSKVMREC